MHVNSSAKPTEQPSGSQPAHQFASSVPIKEVNVLLHKSLEEFVPEAASKSLTHQGEQTDVAKCDCTLGQAMCVCVRVCCRVVRLWVASDY